MQGTPSTGWVDRVTRSSGSFGRNGFSQNFRHQAGRRFRTLYANYRLLPLLSRFTGASLQIGLELSLSNRVVDLVQFVLPSTGRAMPWIFRNAEGKDIDYAFRSRLRILDDALGCVSWCNAGGGLFQIYPFIAEPAVRRGERVEVLQDYGGRSRPFSIIFPQNRHLSARARAFVDFMLAMLRQEHPRPNGSLHPTP